MFRAFARYAQPHAQRVIGPWPWAASRSSVWNSSELAADRHFGTLQPLFASACGDQHANVARNAAFGLGALCERAPANAKPHLQGALHALFPLVQRADASKAERQAQDAAASDNALASMFRVCAADVQSAPSTRCSGWCYRDCLCRRTPGKIRRAPSSSSTWPSRATPRFRRTPVHPDGPVRRCVRRTSPTTRPSFGRGREAPRAAGAGINQR